MQNWGCTFTSSNASYSFRLEHLTLFQEKYYISVHYLKGKELPGPVREREQDRSCSQTIFGLQSGLCLSDVREHEY